MFRHQTKRLRYRILASAVSALKRGAASVFGQVGGTGNRGQRQPFFIDCGPDIGRVHVGWRMGAHGLSCWKPGPYGVIPLAGSFEG